MDKLFSIYEAKLSSQMVKSLGKSIIKMYLMGACAILGMRNQNTLSEDLGSDPFLNFTLQRFTCELYHRFGSFLAPLSIGLITSRHYLSEWGIENGHDRHEVMTKYPKKVGTGKRLAEWNYRKRKENLHLAKTQSESNITYIMVLELL